MTILEFPIELLGMIGALVEKQQDLRALILTCRCLQKICQPIFHSKCRHTIAARAVQTCFNGETEKSQLSALDTLYKCIPFDSVGKTKFSWYATLFGLAGGLSGKSNKLRALSVDFTPTPLRCDSKVEVRIHIPRSRKRIRVSGRAFIVAVYFNATAIMSVIINQHKEDESTTLTSTLTRDLQNACRWGQLDAISLLLENGANPDNLDVTDEPDGLRPCLEVAGSANLPTPMRDNVVNLLLEKGATPTTLGLMFSAKLPSSVAIAKTFLSKNLALNFSTRFGENLLMVAVNAKNAKLVQFLLPYVNAARADIWGRTLPIIAAYTGCTAIFDIVIEHIMRKCKDGKDLIEASDKDGRTALMYACMRGHVDIAVTLIERYDGNLSQRDRWNDCALSFSIIHRLNVVTKKLQEKLQRRLPRGEVQFILATPERDLAANTHCERQGCACNEIFVRWDPEWRDRRCCTISDERLDTLRRTWMGKSGQAKKRDRGGLRGRMRTVTAGNIAIAKTAARFQDDLELLSLLETDTTQGWDGVGDRHKHWTAVQCQKRYSKLLAKGRKDDDCKS